jgi:hypothetical protein
VVLQAGVNGEPANEVRSVTQRRATMADCMKAFQRVGLSDTARFQFVVYGETLEAVNGAPVDPKWKMSWGRVLFERMSISDLNEITALERQAGVQTMVQKRCSQCGKEWEVEVSPMSFFASGLRKR